MSPRSAEQPAVRSTAFSKALQRASSVYTHVYAVRCLDNLLSLFAEGKVIHCLDLHQGGPFTKINSRGRRKLFKKDCVERLFFTTFKKGTTSSIVVFFGNPFCFTYF